MTKLNPEKRKAVKKLVKQAEEEVIRKFVGRGEVKPPRPTSKRARMLRELREDGLTAEEIAEKFDWKPRDVMDALRLLAKANGYNVSLGQDGRWRATEPETK